MCRLGLNATQTFLPPSDGVDLHSPITLLFGDMGKGNKPPALVENLEQHALYEEYIAMGAKRSLAALMEFTDRSWKTVQKWSVRFNWVKRAQERDKELMETAGLETPKENVAAKKLALALVNRMIKDVGNFDEQGNLVGVNVQAKNVFDLKTLMEVRDIILGIKDKAAKTAAQNQQTNIDKAIFIIKK